MIGGYWGKLLRINLSTQHIITEELPWELLELYLGGSGLGTRLLYDEVPAGTNPLSSFNKIIFATGPFQGSGIPGSGKWAVVSKSPLTHTFAVSTAGASFGDMLKKTGYDAILVEGESLHPVYLSIIDGEVELRDGTHLFGLDALETVEKLKEEHKGVSVATIGTAGERQVAIASIVADGHSFAGRCGLGAVMGSKKLKAIVVKGDKRVPLAHGKRVQELNLLTSQLLRENTRETFFQHGTSILVSPAELIGDLPIKYWSGDVWREEAAQLGAPYYTERLKAKPWPCKFCPIGCHRKIQLDLTDGTTLIGAGAEYESLGMLGSCCLIHDLESVSLANEICNRLGIDTISAGSFVAFTMECFEKGYLTKGDIGYRALFGDSLTLLTLLKEIGNREGFGEIFAEGILPAAKKIGQGALDLAVHVKGLDLPAHDPRTYFSLAINYVTSTRGACHLRGFPHLGESDMTLPEVGFTEAPERFSFQGQASMTILFQDLSMLLDSLVCCLFMQACGMDLTITTDLFNAITGFALEPINLMEIGERIFNLQRLINCRDGYKRESDVLPARMFEPAKEGYRAQKVPTDLPKALVEYYKLRGWDKGGVPLDGKLKSLKLVE